MTIQFLAKSPQIKNIVVGQNGKYQVGTEKTKMEKGGGKLRVVNPTPLFEMSVSIICTRIGAAQIQDFYLNDGKQGVRWFGWDWLPDIEENSLVRIPTAPNEQMLHGERSGLYELKFTVEARCRMLPVSQILIEDIRQELGSIAEFYAAQQFMKNLDLQPQLDAWAALTVPLPEYTTFTHDVFEDGVFE